MGGALRPAGRAITAVAVLALSVGCQDRVSGPSSSPSAAVEGRVVKGEGALADDWSDEPRLVPKHTPRSDLVGLWQAVLWADGYLARSSVNCTYDTATVQATRVWQSNHGLSADGIVGPVTYGFAGRRLVLLSPWTVYRGEVRDLPLRRGRKGAYEVDDTGHLRMLRLDRVTLTLCHAR
ncbi:peptidoglycan-binding protein [Streptomyces griseoluteus]|uniref:peptidoglycan-binding domain-containing protein n=1 Tax=Streptomyces griseoluteus TaxID=29306 RepID=UPI00369A4F7B